MAKDPAVLFYTQDFLVGTITMTMEQKGKYITLLCLQHQKQKLTLKDLQTYLTEEDIEVAEKFPKQSDGFYYNVRMYEEAIKRKNYTESRRNNRKKKDDVDILQISKSYVSRMENEDANANANVNKIDNEYEVVNEQAELEREYSKSEREDMLAEVITGSLDKEQKEMINKFDNLFGDVK
jgi:hypothetical protein